MARQYLQDGPYIDPPITSPLSADVATTAVDMWSGAQYTPVFAADAKAGKIYVVKAGGIISTGASGALTISPFWGAAGIALGASVAQTVTVSVTNVPWLLEYVVVVRSIGAVGNNSTVTSTGVFQFNGVTATAASNNVITFGSTATTAVSVDTKVNKDITIQKTLSVAGSFSTNWCYIYSPN